MRIPEIWDVLSGSAGAVEQGIEAGRACDLLHRSQTLVESHVFFPLRQFLDNPGSH